MSVVCGVSKSNHEYLNLCPWCSGYVSNHAKKTNQKYLNMCPWCLKVSNPSEDDCDLNATFGILGFLVLTSFQSSALVFAKSDSDSLTSPYNETTVLVRNGLT